MNFNDSLEEILTDPRLSQQQSWLIKSPAGLPGWQHDKDKPSSGVKTVVEVALKRDIVSGVTPVVLSLSLL